jgi:2-keto-4-pentenoate hydratase
MTITGDARHEAAGALLTALVDRVPIPPLVETYPGFDPADAYATQQILVARRLAGGRHVVGHKVGLTAKAMQELLGVDEPDFGLILDDMVLPDGGQVSTGLFIAPRVEPEITFLLSAPLRGPGVTVADVLAATEAVAPSLEIVDSRIADWKITLADTIADNASSAAMVAGAFVPLADTGPLSDLAVDLLVGGEVVSSGTGAAVLGDPALAVAWLANNLATFGAGLESGHLVMPGSCTSAPFVQPGDHIEAHFAGLGSVSITFT